MFWKKDRFDFFSGHRRSAPAFRFPIGPVGGFTLIELLVVITNLAILAAIAFPVLVTARARVLEARCINNTKELQTGSALYAGDNDDYMIPNSVFGYPVNQCWCPNSATAGAGMNWLSDAGNTNVALLAKGLLAPFLKGHYEDYRCPADVWPSRNGIRVRDYSMQGQVGNLYCQSGTKSNNPHGVAYVKLSDLHSTPGPADTIVFLEEHPNSLLNPVFDGYLAVDSSGGTFPDVPGSNHFWDCGMSFADGHSEMHPWTTSVLQIPVAPDGGPKSEIPAGTQNIDWYWFTTHCSAYNP